jgi:hypothetical protein
MRVWSALLCVYLILAERVSFPRSGGNRCGLDWKAPVKYRGFPLDGVIGRCSCG